MKLAPALVALTACNAAFGIESTRLIDAPVIGDDAPSPPDRDRDGVPDPDDPCIASIADGKGDWNGDGLSNEDDACPFGYDDSANQDGDGLCNECDPLPMDAGDRLRCLMSFQNVRLTRDLWFPRGGAATWNLLATFGIVGQGTDVVVAAESFEGSVTTGYVAQFAVGTLTGGASQGGVTLWLRTNSTASAVDIGCEARGDGSSTTVALRGSSAAPQTVPQPIQRVSRIHAVVAATTTGGTNVSCRVNWLGLVEAVVSSQVALPPGHVGFGIESINAMLQTLVVTDRDDMLAL